MLPTPLARDGGTGNRQRGAGSLSRGGGAALTVSLAVDRGYLPTPTASLYGSNQGGASGREGQKKRPSLERLTGGVWIALREWLMGWPIGWTALEPLATDRFLEWCASHGKAWPEESADVATESLKGNPR